MHLLTLSRMALDPAPACFRVLCCPSLSWCLHCRQKAEPHENGKSTAGRSGVGHTRPKVVAKPAPAPHVAATMVPAGADPAVFETTRSGRVRLPPLAFWCNQTVVKVRPSLALTELMKPALHFRSPPCPLQSN